ncbi:hypothetical protein H9Y04_10455 [Streptomyces sp. TRM66268-LWL]|uniref:Ig-like domain-containing protein n=1 Tax=Streptomyces polyasparticus TaxID=2767826 RepID=A0ABR7SF59_9ACTN|nr:hypothetical protein [Streptomyces polyasparticus]MBC9712988.1 hypothetical protein [Streptomyces polyasparticus]
MRPNSRPNDGRSQRLGRSGAAATAASLALAAAVSFTVMKTVDLGFGGGAETFVEIDPATGFIWYGHGTKVYVRTKDGAPQGTIDGNGADLPHDIAFDGNRAYIAWVDHGSSGEPGSDDNGGLTVHDTAKPAEPVKALALDGLDGGGGSATLAVAPGGAAVYIGDPLKSKVHRIVRQTSPKVTQAPEDLSVESGDAVTLSAKAVGEPEPTVKWQVSPDGGQTWNTIAGATGTTFDFAAKAAQDGYQYRAEFENAAGKTRTRAATLTVNAPTGPGGGSGGGDGDGNEEDNTSTVTGPKGQKLTVTPVHELAAEDQKIKVSGTGYDDKKGIYVALCVDNGPGEVPTPCVGGVDMSGEGGASSWVNSDPPAGYEDATVPYGQGGSFEVELTVDAKDEYTDCMKTRCAIVTRADHTAAADRSADVRVPVDFKGGVGSASGGSSAGTDGGADSAGGSTGGSSAESAGGTGTDGSGSGALASTGVTVASLAGAAALLVAGGWYVVRRTREESADSAS